MLDSNAPCTAGTKNLDKNRYRRIAPCKIMCIIFQDLMLFPILQGSIVNLVVYCMYVYVCISCFLFLDDHTRVVLTGSNDYINASYIKVCIYVCTYETPFAY